MNEYKNVEIGMVLRAERASRGRNYMKEISVQSQKFAAVFISTWARTRES